MVITRATHTGKRESNQDHSLVYEPIADLLATQAWSGPERAASTATPTSVVPI